MTACTRCHSTERISGRGTRGTLRRCPESLPERYPPRTAQLFLVSQDDDKIDGCLVFDAIVYFKSHQRRRDMFLSKQTYFVVDGVVYFSAKAAAEARKK